jgi:hypothetical protein
MSQSLTKKEAQQQQVQGQKQYTNDTVTEEKHSSANASVCVYLLASTIRNLLQAINPAILPQRSHNRILYPFSSNPPNCMQIP